MIYFLYEIYDRSNIMEDLGEFERTRFNKHISWRIIVQPNPITSNEDLDSDLTNNPGIQIVKEMFRWEKVVEHLEGGLIEYWNRIDCKPVPLEAEITNGVSVSDGKIKFDGQEGFICIKDRGYAHDIKKLWDIDVKPALEDDNPILLNDPPNEALNFKGRKKLRSRPITDINHQTSISTILFGRNIYIEVELDLLGNTALNPIFFAKQNAVQDLALIVNKANDMQSIIWSISDNYYETYLYKVDGNYWLNINQDRNRSPNSNEPTYFEFLADNIPLKVNSDKQEPEDRRSGDTDHSHYFSYEPIEWYIGHIPNTDKYFQGSIRRLVFDPNASCPGCP
jgi:hypothetical protein